MILSCLREAVYLLLQLPYHRSLQMQVPNVDDIAAELDPFRAAQAERGMRAWLVFIRAHATLMRALATEAAEETGLTLGEFDVLAQLAVGGGQLRMTDLAARAFSSRSGMTRRVDRLVEMGLVTRETGEADGRAVVVALTDAGLARLREVVPVNLRAVTKRFVDPLDDEELEVIERALAKVTVDCSFG
jgi:DNA-binding MarR family transcriptional regulator